MSNLFGELIRDELINMKIATLETVRGCSPQEIEGIKSRQGVDYLPGLYVEYLAVLGKEDGDLHVGSDRLYSHLLLLKDWAKELLEENDQPFDLPADAFVFLMHQGYQFLYFPTANRDNDPPVFYYTEDPNLESLMPQRKSDHLSEFLTIFVADERNRHAQEAFLARWKRKAANNPV
jgi:hypothetical protein